MSFFRKSTAPKANDTTSRKAHLMDALLQTNGLVTCSPDGKITSANAAFTTPLKITEVDLVGTAYRDMVDDSRGAEFDKLWTDVCSGKVRQDRDCRHAPNGEVGCFDLTYLPFETDGQVTEISIMSRDVTAFHERNLNALATVAAISRSMAVIEFDLSGNILGANENFCATTGYSVDELRGKHHRIFMRAEERETADYAAFWERLGRGSSEQGQIKRLNKAGEQIWLEATYDTLFDLRTARSR